MPSTAIRAIEYNVSRQELFVTFVTGREYRYERVPQDVYDAFRASSSKVTFFNREIRDRYPYREVSPLAG